MGKIYVGTPQTELNVAFETGSSHLALTSTLCSNCQSKAYDFTKSESFKNYGKQISLDYMPTYDRQFETVLFSDKVCIGEANGTCLPHFKFFAISKQQGFPEDFQGILGIAP